MYCTAQEIKLIFCNNYKWSVIYKNFKSLHCTPETNIVHQLYLNQKIKKKNSVSSSIKKLKKKRSQFAQ